MSRYAANTVRAHRAGWVAPYPRGNGVDGNLKLERYLGDPLRNLVPSAVMYLTCMNIALDNGTQALERWCDKWLTK